MANAEGLSIKLAMLEGKALVMDITLEMAKQRRAMIDGQIAVNKIIHTELLSAMAIVPRELFVPSALRSRAYSDEAISLRGLASAGGGNSRKLLTPLQQAQLLQAVWPKAGDKLLIIAANTGYLASLAARMGCLVVAVEADGELARVGNKHCEDLVNHQFFASDKISWRQNDYSNLSLDGGQYQSIIIEGGVANLPPSWIEGLVEGGKIAYFEQDSAQAMGRLTLRQRSGLHLSKRIIADGQVPLLTEFSHQKSFHLA